MFHALAEPTRRAIVERLTAGPSTVTDLAKPFDMTLAAIVQHLQVLEESGVIRTEKVGRVRTCRIEPRGLRLAEKWIAERRTLWEQRSRPPRRVPCRAPPTPSSHARKPTLARKKPKP